VPVKLESRNNISGILIVPDDPVEEEFLMKLYKKREKSNLEFVYVNNRVCSAFVPLGCECPGALAHSHHEDI
jgi:hypothetical protein